MDFQLRKNIIVFPFFLLVFWSESFDLTTTSQNTIGMITTLLKKSLTEKLQ